MKTLRFIGIALLTVLMSVAISSCSKSDDDNGGEVSASIEGTWYLKAEKWYGWKNGQPDMSVVTGNETYADYADVRIWVIKKSGNNLIVQEKQHGHKDFYERTFESLGNNEYKKGNDKMVINTLTTNSLVVEYYDNFYDEGDDEKEYGFYSFMR